jgi:hypothetical protein
MVSSGKAVQSLDAILHGGWALKRRITPPPVKGFMMNMRAVAGLACMGLRSTGG